MKTSAAELPRTAADLASIKLFSELTDGERDEIFAGMAHRRVRRGQVLMLAQEFEARVGVIWSGSFNMIVSLPPKRSVTLTRLERGSAFAYVAQLIGTHFGGGHRLQCREAGVLLEYDAAAFNTWRMSMPHLADAMLRQAMTAAADFGGRIYELSALTARERIQAELLRMARDGEWIGRRPRIAPKPTHQEIADQVGVVREVATRCLKALADEGLIRVDGDALEVLDVDRLLALDAQATGRRIFNPDEFVGAG